MFVFLNIRNQRGDKPMGEMSYLEYKHRIEFNEDQIKELCEFSKENGIEFFASVWDLDSVKVMAKYTNIVKIGSACITDLELCKVFRDAFDTLIVSTGMSTEEEIEDCIAVQPRCYYAQIKHIRALSRN